jgi:hypothetical protein
MVKQQIDQAARRRPTMLGLIGIALIVVGFLALLAFINLFPVVPHSPAGWLAFFFVGIPFYVLAQGAGELFSSAARFSHSTSVERIAIGAAVLVLACLMLYFPWTYIIHLVQS